MPSTGCRGPRTRAEKHLAVVCLKSCPDRNFNDVAWLTSYLRQMRAFQRIPTWKMDALCRNMGVLFIPQDADAAIFCMDPSFSYFVVSGTLLPVVGQCPGEPAELGDYDESSGDRVYDWFDAKDVGESMPPVTRHGEQDCSPPLLVGDMVHQQRPELDPTGALVEGEALDAPATLNGNNIGFQASTDTQTQQAQGNDYPTKTPSAQSEGSRLLSLTVESVISDMKSTSSSKRRRANAPLRSGHGLDEFLRYPRTRNERGFGDSVTAGRDKSATDRTEKRTVVGVNVVDPGRRWRLNATTPVCIARVRRRALKQLELEEPQREIEKKIALLQKSEIFCKDFAGSVLRELAGLMERHEHMEASVVLRKGAIADKVLVVASGDAIKLGDRRADCSKNASSLHIKAGQVFGAEEVVAMLPVYVSNLIATTALVSYTFPADAFREAIRGVHTQALRRIVGRAHIVATHSVGMNKACDAQFSRVREGPRPFTAAGVEGECPLHRSLISSDGSLPILKPSETIPSPVSLVPIPFFSTSAARDYMRVTGTRPETDPEERMNSMAAVFTPWAWHPPAEKNRAKHSCERPQSAPPTRETDDPPPSVPHHPVSAPPVSRDSASSISPILKGSDVNGSVPSPERRTAENRPRNGAGNDAKAGADCPSKTSARRRVASPDFRSLGPSESFATIATLIGRDGNVFPPSDRSTCAYSSDGDADHGFAHAKRQTATTEEAVSGPWRNRRGRDNGTPVTHRRSTTTNPHDDHTREIMRNSSNLASPRPGSAHPTPGIEKRGSCGAKNARSQIVASSFRIISICQSDRELAVARRAVSGRAKRQAVCRLFSTREGAAAGMTAAQRALRGPFVMSRMGNARARASWRPANVFMI